MDHNKKIQIISISDLLTQQLTIPLYQRPYKWSTKNIEELLDDILIAINNKKEKNCHPNYKYRIGTILLHKNEKKIKSKLVYDIVDGQQRVISLILLSMYLYRNENYPFNVIYEEDENGIFVEKKFNNKTTQKNIHDNYETIKSWFISNGRKDLIQDFIKSLSNLLEVVIITVDEDKESEAFQLFDSQNNRGKPLDPHDLLKAFHLREMRDQQIQMEAVVDVWESIEPDEIANLFEVYLFPILCWSRNQTVSSFTVNDIDIYKGIPDKEYNYAKRTIKAMPEYQICEPLIPGEDFFKFVNHYLKLNRDIKVILQKSNNQTFLTINKILSAIEKNQTGLNYAKNLFYCVLLSYYDRFGKLDESVIRKLFIWSFMLRVDMDHLGFDSINKYAIGDLTKSYTNKIPMFSKIYYARRHSEVSNLEILVYNKTIEAELKKKKHDKSKWEDLYITLKHLNGEL